LEGIIYFFELETPQVMENSFKKKAIPEKKIPRPGASIVDL